MTVLVRICVITFLVVAFSQSNADELTIRGLEQSLVLNENAECKFCEENINDDSEFGELNFELPEDRPVIQKGPDIFVVKNKDLPPLTKEKVAIEIFAGTIGTIITYFVVNSASGNCTESGQTDSENNWDCFGDDVIDGVMFGPLGGAVFTYATGSYGNETGGFWKAVGGSYVGSLLGFFAALGMQNVLGDPLQGELGLILVPLTAGVGATMGFNSSRRYKSELKSKALMINLIDYKF